MANFKDLLVWQKSIDLVTEVYKITSNFPSNEKYELVRQLRKSAISIPSNIAEGNSRRSVADYIQFIKIARGSAAEFETQIIISKKLKFIDKEKHTNLHLKITEISKMLNGLINYLNTIK